jgi:predicted transcriptional regulator
MTYKVGSLGQFMAWTKEIVRDPARVADHPKRWASSVATARKSLRTGVSPEAMVKLLSPANIALLRALAHHRPGSVRELAALARRKEASVSRTLKKLAAAGIVEMVREPPRRSRPVLVARKVRLEIDLAAEASK